MQDVQDFYIFTKKEMQIGADLIVRELVIAK